jgi:hypothetical protein
MRPVSLYCNTSDFGSQKQGSATARHKRFKMTKITVFPECQTTDVTMNVNGVWGDDAESLQMGL